MDNSQAWHGVPLEFHEKWRKVFQASQEGLRLSAACPACGEHQLCRYFGGGRPLPQADVNFANRGASWEWCGACHAFEHASGLVPRWWQPLAGIDEAVLTATPKGLEQQLKDLGFLKAIRQRHY